MAKQLFVPTSTEMHEKDSQREILEAKVYHKGMHEHYRQMLEDLFSQLEAGKPVVLRFGHHEPLIVIQQPETRDGVQA